MRRLFTLGAAALLALAPAPVAAAQSDVGVVRFANSGAAAAQAPFLRGLALLHNFEYSAAAAAFREARAADPGFVMAAWGEAMTYNHPVWMEQDAAAGRAALARLAPTRAERLARAATPRERGFLEAVELLYGDGTKEDRDRLYSDRMRALFESHPDDVDARAFYALSLLGLAHQGRDLGLYMRAAGLLEEVFPENRRHPGVLHYLIHSYDDPVHAPLGLRAARLYADVAPEAGHALHMTTHIFLALGMWDETVAENVQAMEVVDRQRAAAGRGPVECGHYAEWLVYANWQRGRAADADAQVDRCRAGAVAELAAADAGGPDAIEPVRSSVRSWADMAVRRQIETGHWTGSEGLELPEGRYLATRLTLAYGDLLAAGSDPAQVRAARQRLEAAQAAFAAAGGTGPAAARRSEIILRQAEGLDRLAAGDSEAGIAALRQAAAAERDIPSEFGPPLVEKPSAELLGDALLRLGRTGEARRAYADALALAPGRRLSARGAGSSAEAAR
jgi:tetratricopeptide (TPR) repeat protein